MGTNIRGNFLDFFTEEKLPQLEAVIQAKREDYPSMLSVFFNTEGMSTDIYQTTTISGLRNPEVKPENVPVNFQTLKPGYKKTYTSSTYASGYRISKEAVDDGKVNFVQRATESFSKGAFEVKEYNLASIFDDAFTTVGYDGKALCAIDHPLENGDGALGINRPAADAEFSLTTYRELRNITQNTVNEDGQIVRYQPKYLVVGQGLQDDAAIILKTQYEPGDNNNDINTVYNHTQLVPGGYWTYLASDTAFFMVCEPASNGLMYLQRESYNVDSDYDKKARAYETMSFERYAFGFHAWRGMAGQPGA